ncbi:hypothetical protein HaLaN_31508 [Haematococcus lacustris]|uniref:Uncharacterized protein n=1 Tax=Haematococcus lacustris TaxID=44745 RepID=A0A6A0AH79_HAELA|nr:hypothetical protein HaLaN_31508 [Haematococcus lacustris]
MSGQRPKLAGCRVLRCGTLRYTLRMEPSFLNVILHSQLSRTLPAYSDAPAPCIDTGLHSKSLIIVSKANVHTWVSGFSASPWSLDLPQPTMVVFSHGVAGQQEYGPSTIRRERNQFVVQL